MSDVFVQVAAEESKVVTVTTQPPLLDHPTNLPTFSMEVGYREVYDPITKTFDQLPLTLLELLYPIEDDVGVVKVAESPLHDILVTLLATMLRVYLGARDWLTTSDVIIHWGFKRAPYKSPDIAAILGGKLPDDEEKSYRVGRDGPLPSFIIEVTSEETRTTDLYEKNLLYAAVGVKEYLIIDILANRNRDWRLIGYRLGDKPRYKRISPDEDGGLSFQSIGLRFVLEERRVAIYDSATGQRLLTPDELKVKAEAESARADAESARAEAEASLRVALEAQLTAMTAKVRELEQQIGAPPTLPVEQ